jgi:aspartyl-tRNA(Asn)/glutamyl-tRNA(Gln) amidotransferase subunit C
MAERVTEADVRHIATLARLGLEPSQVRQLVSELNAILDHMDALARVDTSDVPPYAAEALPRMPLRPDDAAARVTLASRDFAPETRAGFFLVPRLATHEDAGE